MIKSIRRINYAKPVAYLTGTGNYTWIFYADGQKHMLSQTLKKVLLNYPTLIRVHKHTAVNLDHVSSWDFANRYAAQVQVMVASVGVYFAISRRRIKEVKTQLNNGQQLVS